MNHFFIISSKSFQYVICIIITSQITKNVLGQMLSERWTLCNHPSVESIVRRSVCSLRISFGNLTSLKHFIGQISSIDSFVLSLLTNWTAGCTCSLHVRLLLNYLILLVLQILLKGGCHGLYWDVLMKKREASVGRYLLFKWNVMQSFP